MSTCDDFVDTKGGLQRWRLCTQLCAIREAAVWCDGGHHRAGKSWHYFQVKYTCLKCNAHILKAYCSMSRLSTQILDSLDKCQIGTIITSIGTLPIYRPTDGSSSASRYACKHTWLYIVSVCTWNQFHINGQLLNLFECTGVLHVSSLGTSVCPSQIFAKVATKSWIITSFIKMVRCVPTTSEQTQTNKIQIFQVLLASTEKCKHRTCNYSPTQIPLQFTFRSHTYKLNLWSSARLTTKCNLFEKKPLVTYKVICRKEKDQ